jgi:hypothetical protein
MLKLPIALLTLALAAAAQVARAGDEGPTHFACDFNKGYSWTYEAGKFQSVPPTDLSFEIGAIDLDKQSASLILDGNRAARSGSSAPSTPTTFSKSPTKAS